MSDVKISILLTCYNFENYIEQAIDSLLNQDIAETYEIIVIDDGSTDQSTQILSNFKKDTKLKIIINGINLGVSQSLNNGFAIAKGEYLCRFDGDDEWEPTFLRELSDVLDRQKDVAMVYSNCSYFNEHGVVTNQNVLTRRKQTVPKANEFKDLLTDYYITAPTLMFRKIALTNIFPLPTHLKFLDWYISLSVSQNYPTYYLEKCIAKYRIHDKGMHITMVKDLDGEKTTRAILKQFLNNRSFTAQELKDISFYHYKCFIMKYFGSEMYSDVRRITRECMKNVGVSSTFSDKIIRRYFFGSFLGNNYHKIKKWIR